MILITYVYMYVYCIRYIYTCIQDLQTLQISATSWGRWGRAARKGRSKGSPNLRTNGKKQR